MDFKYNFSVLQCQEVSVAIYAHNRVYVGNAPVVPVHIWPHLLLTAQITDDIICRSLYIYGAVAQLGERIPRTDEVGSSSLLCSTNYRLLEWFKRAIKIWVETNTLALIVRRRASGKIFSLFSVYTSNLFCPGALLLIALSGLVDLRAGNLDTATCFLLYLCVKNCACPAHDRTKVGRQAALRLEDSDRRSCLVE